MAKQTKKLTKLQRAENAGAALQKALLAYAKASKAMGTEPHAWIEEIQEETMQVGEEVWG